jgi:hypothetical protein
VKAYLAWPVKFRGLDLALHVTAKYLGNSPFSIEDITDRLKGLNTGLDLSKAEWAPNIFGGGTYVLELILLNKDAYSVNAALASLREDDYPKWRPHVSVPSIVWKNIRHQELTPKEVVAHVGPLTLFVDKRAVQIWGTWRGID